MSLLDQIASAIGHTSETLAQAAGTTVGMLESVISGLSASGIDAISAASRLGLTPESLLRGIVTRMGGDPHQQLLNRLVGPVKAMSDPLASLTSQWLHVADLHQSTASIIHQHIQDLFQGSGTESYSGPAADMLLNTHQDLQRYFSTLTDHAQTQQTRHSTLSGHMDDYVSQMTSQVNGLSAPAAALALLSLDAGGSMTPLIDPQFIQGVEENAENLQTDADGIPPGPEDPIWDFLELCVGALYLFAGICIVINWAQSIIASFQSQQKSTSTTQPPKKPQGTPPVNLSPAQEDLAKRLYKDYGHTGLTLDDIRDIIKENPNLTEAQLRALLSQYTTVIKANPNLVKKYGALAVFEEFIALAAYDPAHGGNYTTKKPSVEKQLPKGMEEATVELGAMEQGKVPWPLKPSTDPAYEGTDPNGQKWDVKSPQSATPDGRTFDANREANGMQKDFGKGEKVIVDDRNITPVERQELYNELKARGQDSKVVWWPDNPTTTP